MRAVRVTSLDGPEHVTVAEVEEPTAEDGQVLVDVHAAGVAFPDALLTRGLYQYKPELPFTPGSEVAGVVRSAPDGSRFSAGDRVVGLTGLAGGMAEVVALPEDLTFPLPEAVSMTAGAGLLFNDLTVEFVLRERAALQEGETVLVHGAAGGIGTSALRLARPMGAGRVIAVVSTPEKEATARAAGADDVVLTEAEDGTGWLARVKELTGGRGVDVVVDPVGGDRFTDSLRSLSPSGRVMVVGFTGGDIPTVKVNRLLLGNVDVRGAGWGAWFMTHPGYVVEQWDRLAPMLADGRVTAPEPVVHPLEDAAAAIASLEQRRALGKVVLGLR
ncbi:NADPH:quinone oxidoreductase family protein [Rhodococcus aerolatus]